MIKFVLLSCLLAAAVAMPHHTPAHQHDAAVEAKPAAAEAPVKPLESEKPVEAKPEEHKEAEASKPEVAKPEVVKTEASSDSVRKDEHKVIETPMVPVEHHAAEPKPVRS